jgi:hypothetical protein
MTDRHSSLLTSVKVGTICVDVVSNSRKLEAPIKMVWKARLLAKR